MAKFLHGIIEFAVAKAVAAVETPSGSGDNLDYIHNTEDFIPRKYNVYFPQVIMT